MAALASTFHPGRAAARTSSTPQLLWRSCKNYASVEPDADRLAGSRFLPKGRRRPVEAGWDTGVRCWLPNCKENVSPIGDDTSLPASRVGTVASDANRRDGRFHAREPVLSGSKATLRARFPVRGLLARIPEHSPTAFSHSILPQHSPRAQRETTHTETTHGQLSARWCARRPRTSCTRKHAQDRKHAGGEKSARASLSSLPLLSFCARAACARARRAEPCGPRFLAAELTPGRVCRARAGRRL